MSTRRRSLGGRPSSALAALHRSGVQWTPDFSAGAAELELETILNRFHLEYRTTAVASGVLKVVARPEDVVCIRSAAAALALEAADTLYLWRRTRTWQSLLEPGLFSVDGIVGLAAVTLASRAVSVDAQVDGTAWSNRILTVRISAVPIGDRRGRQLIAAIGVQLIPLILWPPPNGGRRILRSIGPSLASAVGQGLVIGDRMRHKGRKVDARALRWASEELQAALTEAEHDFHAQVLAPVPAVLRAIARELPVDPEAAAEVATEEEQRLRRWMASPPPALPPSARSTELAEVETGVRRLGRRIEGGVRFTSSIVDSIEIARRSHRHPGVARLAQVAIVVRGATGLALATDLLERRLGDRTARRVVAATDVLVVAATGVHARAEHRDRSVAGWVERLVYEASATAGAARANGTDVDTHLAMATTRAALALTSRRPWHQRLAAAANEALVVITTGRQVRTTFETSLDQAGLLTLSTLDVTGQRTDLHDLHVQQRAFVHDGVAQVLAAVRAGELDTRDLRYWLETERVRVEAVLGIAEVGHAGDLVASLPALIEEFERRGLYLLTESSELPDWTKQVGGTVVEIVREALNNVVKHTDGDSAWCGILHQDDDTVLVRVCDFATDYPVFRPGGGTGTATMIALARQIGAEIEWFQTPTGGAEVRIVVHEPDGPIS